MEARVRSLACTKKETGSVSGEGDKGPPTSKRIGGEQKGEMGLSGGKWERGVGDEMLYEDDVGLTASTEEGFVDDTRDEDSFLLGIPEIAMVDSC